ncbi:MAG: hypothetical protein JJ896_18415 [Rhodothermales bacterium]|nr:hypothetical protein [Rhodothermales bacterium]MBO6781639.1 hypothetical protein [Rhodothermales bacterium]
MTQEPLDLSSHFAPADPGAWLEQVLDGLRIGSLEQASWLLGEAGLVAPYYTEAPTHTVHAPGAWQYADLPPAGAHAASAISSAASGGADLVLLAEPTSVGSTDLPVGFWTRGSLVTLPSGTLLVDAVHAIGTGAPPAFSVAVGLSLLAESCADEEGATGIAFPIDTSYFPSMASLRALRLGAERILSAFGVDGAATVLATAGREVIQEQDAYGNLLRLTTVAMSAVCGGAHVVALPPFDSAEGERGIRLSRNISHLLRHEGLMGLVSDPGRGSYYIEQLTAKIGNAAWAQFQAWESEGGFRACRREIESRMAAFEREYVASVTSEERVLVGVNRFTEAGA